MYLLIRKISPYTEKDLLLGAFREPKKAEQAKEKYIKEKREADEWAEQAYREVDLEEDVRVIKVSDLLKRTVAEGQNVVFVVSLLAEGFGQITREVDSIFSSEAEARKFVELKNTEELEYDPSWFIAEEVPLH